MVSLAGWFRPGGPKTPAETAADYVRIALASVEYTALQGTAETGLLPGDA